MVLTKEEKNARNRAYVAKARAKKAGELTVTDKTTPPVEVKLNPQLEAFLGSSATKPNPNPVAQPNPAAPTTVSGARTPVTNMASMPIPPALFKFADASMRKIFKREIEEDVKSGGMAPDPLDNEQAAALAQACEEMLSFYKVKGSPGYGFGIMIFFWILPYLLMIPKKLENSKKDKEDKGDGRKAAAESPSWLRKREPEPEPKSPHNIVVTEQPATQLPGPSAAGGRVVAVTTAEQLIRTHDGSGETRKWEVLPLGSDAPDSLAAKRGHALL